MGGFRPRRSERTVPIQVTSWPRINSVEYEEISGATGRQSWGRMPSTVGLTYGYSRSRWVSDAIQLKLDLEDELDALEDDLDEAGRREFVVEAVRDAIENRD